MLNDYNLMRLSVVVFTRLNLSMVRNNKSYPQLSTLHFQLPERQFICTVRRNHTEHPNKNKFNLKLLIAASRLIIAAGMDKNGFPMQKKCPQMEKNCSRIQKNSALSAVKK